MKYIVLVLLVLSVAVVGCSNGPTPTPIVIVVTATPRPTVALTTKQVSDGVPGIAGGHIRGLLNLGWTRETAQDCSDGTCMALASPDECGYLLLYFDPATGVEDGFSYGIDFESDWCPDGDVMAETQYDAFEVMDCLEVGYWLGEQSDLGTMPETIGESIGGACGSWECNFTLAEDLFGIIAVHYR